MYLVFDIGGTSMRIGVSPDGTNISQVKSVTTPPEFENGISTIQEIAAQLSHAVKIEKLAGGIAGPLDKDKTMMIASPQISGWIQKPFKRRLEEVFNCDVYLENDATLGGLGEAVFGAGRGYDIVAYISIGTGLGGTRFVKGKIDENSLGFEPGHQIIDINSDLVCGCGGKGHLEAFAGGASLEIRYNKKPENINDPKIWDEVAKYLAIGLNNTIVHWSPDMIVLGGSVAKSISLDDITKHLETFLTIFPSSPPLVKATLGDMAGLLGALEYLKS